MVVLFSSTLCIYGIGPLMNNILVFGFGSVALIVFIIYLWYLFQTVRIIWSYNFLLAIGAVLLSPFVHIIFCFLPKDGFDKYERGLFKKYFISIGALIVLGIGASIAIPNIESQYQADTITDEIDTSEPWEWDIRAESDEEGLGQNDANNDDTADVEALHYEAIFQVHPDADKIVDSPEFALWLQEQTPEQHEITSEILKEGIATEVIYVLTEFKTDLSRSIDNDYHARKYNAQVLAQRQYQEKQNREMESIKSSNQVRQREPLSANSALQADRQALPSQKKLSYSERQEREKTKDLISQPIKGSKGLTRAQIEALASLETGQPMPSRASSDKSSAAAPRNMTNCDGSGCWDSNGTRYNKGAGNTYFPSGGGVCQNIGGQMQCN